MKLQILDEGLDSNREGETISFFNELDIETRTMLVTSVSFLTRFPQRLSSEVVSFFNELEIKKPCSKTFVSFFNEVASETKNYPRKPLFHFLTRLLQRRKNYPRSLSS
jgi:hypothetical protein